MPQSSFGGEYLYKTIPAMVAAYAFHICQNHPFIDGNKRVALASSAEKLFSL
jgi:death-on-curing protein